MTIQEIQAAIDAKYDTRQIVNMIADYIEANPSGGTDTNLGNSDLTLTADRLLNFNGHDLHFEDGQFYVYLDPADISMHFYSSPNGDVYSEFKLNGNIVGGVNFRLTSSDNSHNQVDIFGDALTSSLAYTADTHTFNGIINLPTQAAPASPNDGDIWREDNTDTGLKIRINGLTKTITVS